MKVSQWRTVIVVLTCVAVLFIAYLLGLRPAYAAAAATLFGTLVAGVCTLAGIAASKNAVEHLGKGSGLAGVAKALFTDAKPGSDEEPKK